MATGGVAADGDLLDTIAYPPGPGLGLDSSTQQSMEEDFKEAGRKLAKIKHEQLIAEKQEFEDAQRAINGTITLVITFPTQSYEEDKFGQ